MTIMHVLSRKRSIKFIANCSDCKFYFDLVIFFYNNKITKTIIGKIMTITYDEFEKVDLRSATIVKAEKFLKARNPSYKIWADFGDKIGVLQSSAQITKHYTTEDLIGRPVVGCINLGERNIAGFISQFLLVGFSDQNGAITLVTTEPKAPNGMKLH